MKYIICNSDSEAQIILSQAKAEGWDGWADIAHHPMTGKVALLMPGYTDYEKFGKEILESNDSLVTEGYRT